MEWDLLRNFEIEYYEDTFTVIVIYDIVSNKKKFFIQTFKCFWLFYSKIGF